MPLLTTDTHEWHSSVNILAGKARSSDFMVFKEDGTLLSAMEVNSFFVGIRTTFPSIISSEILAVINEAEINVSEVSEFGVYKELKKLNRNCAFYPGELPLKLSREFAIFLAKPLSSIINQGFQEQVFPSACKRPYVRVIPKVKVPKSCDQLRPILITPNLFKVLELFIYRQLMSRVFPSLDSCHYGCLNESSTTVYIVIMYHLIVEWLEL